ncbi:uncharacterized protein LOC112562384 [Pomacea canaliculata]|nr:uncharacterized protein LOC112562384 [Pomacea canaliculata]
MQPSFLQGMVQLTSSPRLLFVLLVLACYHGSLFFTPRPSTSESSSSTSSFTWTSSSSWFSLLHSAFFEKTGASGWGSVGVGAYRVCQPSTEQQRLVQMLNMMESVEHINPENLEQLIRSGGQHNLSAVCPAFRPTDRTGLESQSLCPWTLEENYEVNRFPRLLMFARCICGHCRGAGWGNGPPTLYSCVPLYHRVAVIRETCGPSGEVHFRWDRESIPVGCVCAHPPARRVDRK